MQGMLEQCWDAFVDLLCHPALARATAYNSTSVADVVRKLLDCQDQHGFGAGAALTVPFSTLTMTHHSPQDACLVQLAAVKPAAHVTSPLLRRPTYVKQDSSTCKEGNLPNLYTRSGAMCR